MFKRSLYTFIIAVGFATAHGPAAAMAEDNTSNRVIVDGSGLPLVMLGGGTRGVAEFAPHVPLIVGRFQMIRVQTLNLMRAQEALPLPAEYSVKLESAQLSQSLVALGIKTPFDLVGHSFGALVALDFALDHPDRVRSLTLAEPPAFWAVPEQEFRSTTGMRNMFELLLTLKPTIEPTDEQLVQFSCVLGNCGLKPPTQSDAQRKEWVFRRSALRGLSIIATHTDRIDRLKNFTRPVLIVTGTDTVSFHRRINEILATQFPDVERLELAGGHGAVATEPQQFVAGLMRFLNRRR